MHAFHGGASFDAIGVGFDALERRHAIVDADVLDAWYEPAPTVLATLRDHLAWLVKTSPPTHGDGLRAAIAARHELTPEHVLIGGGTSSLMFEAFPQLLRRGERVDVEVLRWSRRRRSSPRSPRATRHGASGS